MSLDDAEILEGIRDVARRTLDWDGELAPDMRLAEDLELDSLKNLTLALEIENRFQVYLDQEGEILTIGELVAAVQRQLDG